MKKHLHNSLRALFLSLAVLLSLPMLAVNVTIDGINYELIPKGKVATVIKGHYSGEVVIPETVEYNGTVCNVTSIGYEAFYKCDGLTSVTIPNSVTSIGKNAFYNCYGLTSVSIGNGVTSIGENAFSGCPALTSVHISNIAAWCNIDFTSIYSNPLYYTHHLYLNGEEVKDLVIPSSVTSIGDYAFYYCDGLTSVTIPNSVKSIGERAFRHCSGLTSVSIGNGVTSIGEWAFYECSRLTSVTIPNSVKSIGDDAFYNCSRLTSVTIGSGVKYIYGNAFANCPELLDVYCYAENVPSTDSYAFYGSYPEYITLHVPDASIYSYKATSPWSGFGKIVALTDEETGIDELKGENGKECSAVYGLSGRRVQKAQKGIYIQNGKVMVQ